MIPLPTESAPSAAGSQVPHPGRPTPAAVPLTLADATGPLLAIVGAYGSGKTEISVNLALALAAAGRRVQIGDLDLVNPYFRCREAEALMTSAGVRVVVPPGSLVFADLPIVLPEVAGLLTPPAGTTSLLDVGGDEVGARSLAAFAGRLTGRPHEVWMVVNSRRPFSDTPAACEAMRASIESASRLCVTGLIVNSHLGPSTTIDVVLEGLRLGRTLAAAWDVPLRALAVMQVLADDLALVDLDVPVLRLVQHMLPPWRTHVDDAGSRGPRSHGPLGRPPRIEPPRPHGGRHE